MLNHIQNISKPSYVQGNNIKVLMMLPIENEQIAPC